MELDGNRIRALRLRKVWTQTELAERADLTESTVNRLERGLQRAHIGTVRKLASALDVAPGEIVRSYDREEDSASG